jgi:hypothetical protein
MYGRCIIPADGFYEWQRSGAAKQPYCFEVDSGALFAFAGILEKWKDPAGTTLETCAILTTTPNAATSAIHDRMPVILDPESHDLWLDPGMKDAETAAEMLKPYDANAMSCYPISTRINHVSNDDEECAARVDLVPAQARLFLWGLRAVEIQGVGRRLKRSGLRQSDKEHLDVFRAPIHFGDRCRCGIACFAVRADFPTVITEPISATATKVSTEMYR